MFGKSTWTLDRSKLLGKGAYGTVFEGQWRGIPVAVKRVPNNSKKEREARQEESTLLKLSNHLNVAKLFHIDSDEHSKYNGLIK
jgi:serine/threonine protein kinase